MLLQKCDQVIGEHRGGSEKEVMSHLALEVGIFHKGSEEFFLSTGSGTQVCAREWELKVPREW